MDRWMDEMGWDGMEWNGIEWNGWMDRSIDREIDTI
jgi:hypothetical protein